MYLLQRNWIISGLTTATERVSRAITSTTAWQVEPKSLLAEMIICLWWEIQNENPPALSSQGSTLLKSVICLTSQILHFILKNWLYMICKKILFKSTSPNGSFTWPGLPGHGKCQALVPGLASEKAEDKNVVMRQYPHMKFVLAKKPQTCRDVFKIERVLRVSMFWSFQDWNQFSVPWTV